MARIVTSNSRESCMSQFGSWAKLCVIIMALLLIGAVGVPWRAEAASAGTMGAKPNLGGYAGPDAPYIISHLAEPVIKPGFKFKVGFLQVFSGIEELATIQKACGKKIKALGGKMIAYDAGLDPQKQVSQMDLLISQKVNIIIAYPTTAANLTQGIAAAKKAGIPVVLVNVPSNSLTPMDPNAAAMVGMAFDQYDYTTIKYIAKKDPKAKLAFIGFGPPTENLPYIVGRAKFWAKKMGLDVLGEVDAQNPSPGAASVAAQGIMGRYPHVQIILGYNDYTTMAAAAALKASGKKGVLVATTNGGEQITANGIKNGSVLCFYRNPWERVGTTAAIAAYDILTKQHLPLQRRMLLLGKLATRHNVNSISFLH